MRLEAIWHQPLTHYASALDEHTIMIRIRTGKGDISQCDLYYGDRVYPKNPIMMFKRSMQKVGSDALFDYYEVELKSDYTRICYYFHLQDHDSEIYYMGGRFKTCVGEDRTQFFQFPFIRREDITFVPSWAKEMIMYQVFPDSFASGHKQIANSGFKIKNHFGEMSVSERGGNIQGLIDNIDYLSDLGINCLYLNPIFVSGTYHKYDIIDYFDIDPCLGDKAQFKQLVTVCHERGIKIILDGVFNHCSSSFFAFKDVMKNGENSIYKGWFYDVKFPIEYKEPPNYQAFAYVKEMPKLNTGNQEVVDYFCKVGIYWIQEMHIDGWRLDVANEVNHDFWRTFRKAIRSVKSDALLIGEVWEDSECWLMDNQFDSTMNYRFSTVCREFFGKREYDEEKFSNELVSMLMRYQKHITYAQMNLLDSHDVPRFIYDCDGDERKLLLASLFQLTFIGAPSIFYGDEVFISGKTESEYRKPMVWKPDNQEQRGITFYKRAIALRKSSKAFTEGSFRIVSSDSRNKILVFERKDEESCYWVILHNSQEEVELNLEIDGKYEEVLSTSYQQSQIIQTGMFTRRITPYEGVVLKRI